MVTMVRITMGQEELEEAMVTLARVTLGQEELEKA